MLFYVCARQVRKYILYLETGNVSCQILLRLYVAQMLLAHLYVYLI